MFLGFLFVKIVNKYDLSTKDSIVSLSIFLSYTFVEGWDCHGNSHDGGNWGGQMFHITLFVVKCLLL